MEGVLLAPVFFSFEKFRWHKFIRNVALHTAAHASRYHPKLFFLNHFFCRPTFFCEMETVFSNRQLTGN